MLLSDLSSGICVDEAVEKGVSDANSDKERHRHASSGRGVNHNGKGENGSTCAHTCSLSFSLLHLWSHTHTLILSLSHTHSHTLSLSFSFSLSYTHSYTHKHTQGWWCSPPHRPTHRTSCEQSWINSTHTCLCHTCRRPTINRFRCFSWYVDAYTYVFIYVCMSWSDMLVLGSHYSTYTQHMHTRAQGYNRIVARCLSVLNAYRLCVLYGQDKGTGASSVA
jgi:hypothetical protein